MLLLFYNSKVCIKRNFYFRKTFNYSHKYSTVRTEDVIHPKNVNFTDPLLNNTIYAFNKNLSIIPDRSTEKSIIQIRKEKEARDDFLQ